MSSLRRAARRHLRQAGPLRIAQSSGPEAEEAPYQSRRSARGPLRVK